MYMYIYIYIYIHIIHIISQALASRAAEEESRRCSLLRLNWVAPLVSKATCLVRPRLMYVCVCVCFRRARDHHK